MGRVRPPKTCARCDAPVLWWRNANRDGQICVDLSSDENGSVQKLVTDDLDHPGRKIVWGKKLSGKELADAVSAGDMLFTVHATTCGALREPNPKPAGLDWRAHQRTGA